VERADLVKLLKEKKKLNQLKVVNLVGFDFNFVTFSQLNQTEPMNKNMHFPLKTPEHMNMLI
jgi:predicted amino acid racemase